jgi:hypothetical protein
MPGLLTHIVIALSLVSGDLKEEAKNDFFIGTVFPDIRYLGVVDRNKTHKKDVTWKDVANEKSWFQKGFLLHSLVDELFDEFVTKNYSSVSTKNSPDGLVAIKVFQDLTLAKKSPDSDWKTVEAYFDKSCPEESEFEIDKDKLLMWHKFVQQYCVVKTKHDVIGIITESFPAFNCDFLKNLFFQRFEELENVPQFPDLFNSFYDHAIKQAGNSFRLS